MKVVVALQALSCTIYRIGCNSSSDQLNNVVNTAKAFQSAGLKLFTLIQYGLYDSNGNLYANEQAPYNGVKAGAAAIATALASYDVNTYEAGIELTRDSAIILNTSYAGTSPSDFNNANW
uniref:Uncharacterized protein n=1 Tax=Acrobeloides nanus TaxID=290746 RepID=A0A914D0A8_9BILA